MEKPNRLEYNMYILELHDKFMTEVLDGFDTKVQTTVYICAGCNICSTLLRYLKEDEKPRWGSGFCSAFSGSFPFSCQAEARNIFQSRC